MACKCKTFKKTLNLTCRHDIKPIYSFFKREELFGYYLRYVSANNLEIIYYHDFRTVSFLKCFLIASAGAYMRSVLFKPVKFEVKPITDSRTLYFFQTWVEFVVKQYYV